MTKNPASSVSYPLTLKWPGLHIAALVVLPKSFPVPVPATAVAA